MNETPSEVAEMLADFQQPPFEKQHFPVQITEENFSKYFFPAKDDYKPQRGQCLARWRATASFVDGWIKRNIIELLAANKAGAETANRVMVRLVSATQRDAIKVLREMAVDLLTLTPQEVTDKPYPFVIEQFYWTNKEYVPADPHWDVINIIDTRDPSGAEFSFKVLPGKEVSDTVGE